MSKQVYVEEKDETDLSVNWQIPMGKGSKFFLDVYIWDTLEGMYANARPQGGDNWIGCYLSYPERVKTCGKFGEIHLLKNEIGGGYVTHELMHVMLDWISFKYKRITIHNHEQICFVMSDMATVFWRLFDDVYKVVVEVGDAPINEI